MSELIEVLQETIKNSVNALDLLDIVYATVTAASPLSLTITATQLAVIEPVAVMTDNVRYKAVTVQGQKVVINPGLVPGDRVLALRANSGQNYIVISKV